MSEGAKRRRVAIGDSLCSGDWRKEISSQRDEADAKLERATERYRRELEIYEAAKKAHADTYRACDTMVRYFVKSERGGGELGEDGDDSSEDGVEQCVGVAAEDL